MSEQTSRNTLADQAFDAISEMIMNQELPLGSVINETSLAHMLGMSRGPVREAIKKLQGCNLVTRDAFKQARVIQFNSQQIIEIFEMREGLEGTACQLATIRMTHAQLQELAIAFDPANRTSEVRADLHKVIALHCGNSRITKILSEDIHYLLQLYLKFYHQEKNNILPRGTHAREEHWQIVQAMLRRDELLAGSLMRAHIRRATEFMKMQFSISKTESTRAL